MKIQKITKNVAYVLGIISLIFGLIPITALTNFGRLPYVRMALAWMAFALLLVAVFWLTHGGFDVVRQQVLDMIQGVRDGF